jgi:hypothetical protein
MGVKKEELKSFNNSESNRHGATLIPLKERNMPPLRENLNNILKGQSKLMKKDESNFLIKHIRSI